MFVAVKEKRALDAARKDGNPQKYWAGLTEAIESRQLIPSDFSIRDVFVNFVEDGHECVSSWSPRHGGGNTGVSLTEAGAVDTSHFANITGQIVFSTVLEAFENPMLIASRVARTVPTEFSGEKIPGISNLGDEAESIPEGVAYPLAGVSEEWIETPATTKRGLIVPVTKEAIFFDRTGILLQKASDVSTWLAVNKEKRVLDAVLGLTDLYRRNGVATNTATYGDSSGDHDWDNLQASNALVDWTDVENAELLFDGLSDPNTGEPIIVTPNTLIVPTALKHTARRIVGATEIRFGDGASNTTQTVGMSPIDNYEILSTSYVKDRTSSATTWFLGDPMAAFSYMENWPITSVEAPSNSEAEFTHDIVQRFKVSERGAIAVIEPRRMVKSTG